MLGRRREKRSELCPEERGVVFTANPLRRGSESWTSEGRQGKKLRDEKAPEEIGTMEKRKRV